MIDVETRVLTEGDAAAYWSLRLEALEQEPASFAESAEEHRATSIELAAARLREADDGSFVLGAFLCGELVGMAGFFREKPLKCRHKGKIWGVYVRANCRRQGIARALLSALWDRSLLLDSPEGCYNCHHEENRKEGYAGVHGSDREGRGRLFCGQRPRTPQLLYPGAFSGRVRAANP